MYRLARDKIAHHGGEEVERGRRKLEFESSEWGAHDAGWRSQWVLGSQIGLRVTRARINRHHSQTSSGWEQNLVFGMAFIHA